MRLIILMTMCILGFVSVSAQNNIQFADSIQSSGSNEIIKKNIDFNDNSYLRLDPEAYEFHLNKDLFRQPVAISLYDQNYLDYFAHPENVEKATLYGLQTHGDIPDSTYFYFVQRQMELTDFMQFQYDQRPNLNLGTFGKVLKGATTLGVIAMAIIHIVKFSGDGDQPKPIDKPKPKR